MDLSGIQRARKAAGMTQDELASRLGVNRATISKYENGSICPSLGQLGSIAKILNTNVYEMIGPDWDKIDMSDAFSDSLVPQMKSAFEQLNKDGQAVAVERVKELSKIPEYQRNAIVANCDNGQETNDCE